MLLMYGLPEVRSGVGPKSRAEFPQYKQIYCLAQLAFVISVCHRLYLEVAFNAILYIFYISYWEQEENNNYAG